MSESPSDSLSDSLPPGHPLAPPAPAVDALHDLANDARVLTALLDDPHPDLSTWQQAVGAQMKRIHDAYRLAAGLDEPPDAGAVGDAGATDAGTAG